MLRLRVVPFAVFAVLVAILWVLGSTPCWGQPAKGSVGGADRHLPPDTELVVSVDVKQLVNSNLFKNAIQGFAQNGLKDAPGVGDFLKEINFEPFQDLHRVILASPSNPGADRGLFLVYGKFDVAKIQARMTKLTKEGPIFKLHQVGDGKGGQIAIYETEIPGQGTPMFLALEGPKLLVASPGKDYVVEAIRRGRSKTALVLKNKAFQATLEQMSPKQTLSLAVLGQALQGELLNDAPQQFKDAVKQIEVLSGGFTLSDDVGFEIAVNCKNLADAQMLKQKADTGLKFGLAALALLSDQNKQLTAAFEIVKSLRVTSKGNVVLVRGRVSPDVIKEALEQKN